MPLKRADMLAGAIAQNTLPAIVRMQSSRLSHDPVAMLLGDDAGCGNTRLGCVAANQGFSAITPAGEAIAVNQDMTRLDTQGRDRAGHGDERGLQDIDPVNLVDRGKADADDAAFENLFFKRSAADRGQLLAVIKPGDAIGAKDDGSCNDRPG